jgi:nucleotidyltransferase/DNA polymerase involved in DNA repair
MPKRSSKPSKTGLAALANIGPAMLRDFELLGITTVEQLAQHTADGLYQQLADITGHRHDPCVWDTFRAAIHEAQTDEKTSWWHWTAERKARQAKGEF